MGYCLHCSHCGWVALALETGLKQFCLQLGTLSEG